MALVATVAASLVLWVVMWALGIKAFDAFLLTAAMVVGAAAYVIVKPYLDRMLGREAAAIEDDGARY